MTQPPHYQPPVVPGPDDLPPPSWPAQPPPPASKSRRPLLWVVGVVGVLLLVGVAGGIGYAAKGGGGKPAAASSAPPLPQDPCGGGICNTEPVAEDTTPAITYTPTTSDFAIAAKVTEKHCFGSAGCNITLKPDVTYNGTLSLDPDVTWEIVYEINGVEDAPQVGNLTIEGTTVHYDMELVSTKSSKSKITIKVTSVEQQN